MEKDKILKLEMEIAYNLDEKTGKKVEAKNPKGGKGYVRDDLNGLYSLLQIFDSRMYDMNDWKLYIKIKNKLTVCYLEKKDKLELSKDQFKFLLGFLEKMIEENSNKSKEKEDKKIVFNEFQIRTLLGVHEQLSELA